MDAESTLWDEIAERLVVIYNQMRLTRSDIEQHKRGIVKGEAEVLRLEALASQYEALFASQEGIPA